ncbi:MAG: hypothetical protein JSR18_08780 [Proteobacteria bacterium]|nr:hypothetical protein [Pseudomonadota bacterium]
MDDFDGNSELERSVRAALRGCVAAVAFLALVAALGPLDMTADQPGPRVHMALQDAVATAAAAAHVSAPVAASDAATFHGVSFVTDAGAAPDPVPQD